MRGARISYPSSCKTTATPFRPVRFEVELCVTNFEKELVLGAREDGEGGYPVI
jgi:hypothetical protein